MAKAKNTKLTGEFDLFPKSVDVVKRNINTFAILFILPFLGALTSAFNTGKIDKDHFGGGGGVGGFAGIPSYAIAGLIGFGIVIFIVIFVVSLFIQAMTRTLELEGAEGKTPSLQHLFDVAKKYWLRLFGFYILYGLMLIGGFILLIFPFFIVLRRYILTPYVMIDKDMGIMDSMKRAAEISKPHKGYIWSIIGVAVLLSLPSGIPVIGPLIAFGLSAAYSVALALRYEELKKLD